MPVVLCPGDLQALLWVEVGVAATAAGHPRARTGDADPPGALCWLTLGLQIWGQQGEKSHKPEMKRGRWRGWAGVAISQHAWLLTVFLIQV